MTMQEDLSVAAWQISFLSNCSEIPDICCNCQLSVFQKRGDSEEAATVKKSLIVELSGQSNSRNDARLAKNLNRRFRYGHLKKDPDNLPSPASIRGRAKSCLKLLLQSGKEQSGGSGEDLLHPDTVSA